MFTNEIVNKVRENNYSPFETMLFIHQYIANKYRIDFDDYSYESMQASLKIEKIITLLCMNGLASSISIAQEKSTSQNYYFNIISIHDRDYSVCGTFANDTISDSTNSTFENGKGFAHCLFPISDLFHSHHIKNANIPDDLLTQSNSICPTTFIKALKKIYQTAPEVCGYSDFNEFAYHALNNSITTSARSFDKNASSKFVQCANTTIYTSVQNNNESTK